LQENGIANDSITLQANGTSQLTFTNAAVESVAAVTNAVNGTSQPREGVSTSIGAWLFNRNAPQNHASVGKKDQISTTEAIEKSLTRNLTQREQREYQMFGELELVCCD
jgi:hypothetical protein